MFRINDVLRTHISTTGYAKVVGINTSRNNFIKESNWDYIISQFEPNNPELLGPSVRVYKKDLENATLFDSETVEEK